MITDKGELSLAAALRNVSAWILKQRGTTEAVMSKDCGDGFNYACDFFSHKLNKHAEELEALDEVTKRTERDLRERRRRHKEHSR